MQSAENVVIYVTDHNYSSGLRIYFADRKKNVSQPSKNPIAKGGFAWIFACNYEGIEQLQQNTSCAVHCRKAAECRKRV